MKNLSGIVTIGTMAALVAFVIYGLKTGIFYDAESLKQFIAGFGITGALVFVIFQAVQVVFPVLPGGIGCLGGVLIYGAYQGFLYNYIGICIGSVAAFLIAKNYGSAFLKKIFGEELHEKYVRWVDHKHFDRLFALAIFLPVAPDDYLCYLAGTTKMTLKKFTAIILLAKPAAIAAYSLGLTTLFNWGVTLLK
ncbi:MAG: VTT domain-containing protein [Lachnospiraceae bacterium]|nr:VTT domain-containing protein [Lachnospiraceae bacterium]